MAEQQDPLADLLTRIRNASSARKRYVDVRHSKMKEAIVKILKDKGFIAHYLIKEENKKGTMRVFLKYALGRQPVLHGLKRMSSPSQRQYVSCMKIPKVFGGMGSALISTSHGVVDDRRARELGLGGELLCLVW